MVNSRFTIAVGAVDAEGKVTKYTTPGAPVFITAPAGDEKCKLARYQLLIPFLVMCFLIGKPLIRCHFYE